MDKHIRLSVFGAVITAAFFTPQAACADTPAPASTAVDASTSKTAPDPAALAEARAIIADGIVEKDRPTIFAAVVQLIQDQLNTQAGPLPPDNDPGIKAIYARHNAAMQQQINGLIARHSPAIYEALAVSYTQEFTLTELRAIRKFVGTAAGRNFLSRSDKAMGSPDITRLYQSVFEESHNLGEAMLTALRKDIGDYAAQHPDVAERMRAADTK